PEFSSHAALALRLLVPGFAIGLLAPLSGAALEGLGRPDTLVKVYAAELPFNVAIVWFLTKHFGIAGAAMSYTVRTVVETAILLVIVYRVAPFSWKTLFRAGMLKPLIAATPLAMAGLWMRDAKLAHVQDIALTLVMLAIYAVVIYL